MNLSLPNHWVKLGVPLKFGKALGEGGQRKIVGETAQPHANACWIELSEVPLMVIDVDNLGQSLETFDTLAQQHGGIEDLFWELTRNGGYHLFFYSDVKLPNIMHRDYAGVHIDVLFRGRCFTSPSAWGGKSYLPGGRSILELTHLNQLPRLPHWIDDLLCQ